MRTRIMGSSVSLSSSPSSPIYTEDNAPEVVEARIHNAASTNISAAGGAWVNFESSTNLSDDITMIELTATHGEPLEIGVGATAGTVTRKFIANRGEGPLVLGVSMAAGTKLWVRSLDGAVTSGLTTLNLMGQP
jgi:hypothetical protein